MKPRNFKFFAAGSLSFLLFLFVFSLETRMTFSHLDLAVSTALQAIFPRSLDVPLSIFTLFGSFEFTCLTVIAVFLWLWRKKHLALWSLALFGMILIFEFIGKFLLYHPNPPHIFFHYELPFSLPTDYVRTNFSFPSGHEARTIFVTVLGLFLAGKFIKNKARRIAAFTFLTVFTIIMAVSRVYLGAHWTSDVIGGFFLGTGMALLSLVYYY
ncbi:MAG: phosphatase PAP2 family protein [Patescibacteria group bacterium]|nr:phosphatase PAP2 family protein [Patescibacteria group bacterium]MCL5431500.1 phosphatase PAP2 family protein [Patescibacteria group bacterium]